MNTCHHYEYVPLLLWPIFFIQHLALERLVAGVQKNKPMGWQSLGHEDRQPEAKHAKAKGNAKASSRLRAPMAWQSLDQQPKAIRNIAGHVVWQSLDLFTCIPQWQQYINITYQHTLFSLLRYPDVRKLSFHTSVEKDSHCNPRFTSSAPFTPSVEKDSRRI